MPLIIQRRCQAAPASPPLFSVAVGALVPKLRGFGFPRGLFRRSISCCSFVPQHLHFPNSSIG